MNIPALSELSAYYNRTDLLEKVVEQLKKDFNWFSFEITFKGDQESPYQELYKQILPLIDELLNDDYPKLIAMLYRIDLDEEFLNRKLKENSQADTDEVITDLILKRELQKVIIRGMYSS
jgi:DNA polymerase III epsilon subunit-like protein